MDKINEEFSEEITRVYALLNTLKERLSEAENVCAYIEDEKDKIESYLEYLENNGKMGDYRPL